MFEVRVFAVKFAINFDRVVLRLNDSCGCSESAGFHVDQPAEVERIEVIAEVFKGCGKPLLR